MHPTTVLTGILMKKVTKLPSCGKVNPGILKPTHTNNCTVKSAGLPMS